MHRLVIALTSLLALSGGAFLAAYLFLFGPVADRAAALAPADTAIYVTIYLEPSTAQQIRLRELLTRLPGFSDEAALDDKIDQITQNLLAGAGIDYTAQIKPWLGGQVAVAIGAPGDDAAAETSGVAFVETTDAAAAQAALADFAEAEGVKVATVEHRGVTVTVTGDAGAHAVVDGLVVLGPTEDAVTRVIDVSAGEGDALGDSQDFRAAMAALPVDHLASVYLDLDRLGSMAGLADLPGFHTASAVLLAEESGFHVAGSAPFDAETADEPGREAFALAADASTLAEFMPADTELEVIVWGADRVLDQVEAGAAGTPEGQPLVDALTSFRALAAFGLGIDVNEEILPLFERDAAIAVQGLGDGAPRGQLLVRPADAAAAAATLDRITEALEAGGATLERVERGGVEVVSAQLPGLGGFAFATLEGVVIAALSADDVGAAVAARRAGASLAASDRYRSAFALAGDRGGNEAWVDLAGLVAGMGLADALAPDARDILQQVGAAAFTAPARDDQIEFHAVLTVE